MSQQVSFIVAFASVFGAAEAIRQTQARARRQEHRSRKNNLVVHCTKSSRFSPLLEGKHVILSGNKLYVDTGTEYDVPFGHRFAGYFLPFPETQHEGLVSTIMDDPPIMNWIYIDRQTYEVKFGTRDCAEPNFKAPFDCTRQDRRLTLGGWEGFCAVQEGHFWALYFDVENNRLLSKVPEGTPLLEIELQRIEMRVAKPLMPESEANGDCEKAGDELETPLKSVSLESPEVD
ncbi:hypothetical protein KVR01_007901 [Diaporthe batatas]|uniref:uncharacterized protein n=1 Tax=Diaporthe batatas TaxID=748121 RepID=UPI001D0362B2|nr:uncharacterized protein KVR01_007901 [Diaporthe batatas]KAG8162136.1 hypothetical protein KVR01_007901 [Diaporthe batatas]